LIHSGKIWKDFIRSTNKRKTLFVTNSTGRILTKYYASPLVQSCKIVITYNCCKIFTGYNLVRLQDWGCILLCEIDFLKFADGFESFAFVDTSHLMKTFFWPWHDPVLHFKRIRFGCSWSVQYDHCLCQFQGSLFSNTAPTTVSIPDVNFFSTAIITLGQAPALRKKVSVPRRANCSRPAQTVIPRYRIGFDIDGDMWPSKGQRPQLTTKQFSGKFILKVTGLGSLRVCFPVGGNCRARR